MDAAYELHRQQLIKAYNSAVKRKDWQAARNYRDELNILVAKKVALSWAAYLSQKQLLQQGFAEIKLAGFSFRFPKNESFWALFNTLKLTSFRMPSIITDRHIHSS